MRKVSQPLAQPVYYAAGLIIIYLLGNLLIYGRTILIPLVLALLIWHFLNSIHSMIRRLPKLGNRLPNWVAFLLTLGIVSLLFIVLINIISNNVLDVIKASSRYQERFHSILSQIEHCIPIKTNLNSDTLFENWNLQALLVGIYNVFTALASYAVVIALYVIFLFVEQHFFTSKFNALLPERSHRALMENILKHMVQDTQVYLGVKTVLSLVAAFASWVIMKAVGLDFSAFWALLIFFLNFIPNIGSIIATAFPILLAFIQFNSLLPSLLIMGGIVSVQFIIGNLVEPRFLGKSLNISAFILLIALAFWGTIWGIIGMFLAVPMTVMMMIIFAHFETTRPIAILLSQNGYIQKAYAKI